MRISTLSLVSILFFLLVSIACDSNDEFNPAEEADEQNNDDTDTEETNTAPGDFEITIEVINFYRASVAWSEPVTTLPNPISYELYLNDVLLADSLTERTYELEGLEELTSYNLKVVAKNEIGETPTTKEFSTPQKRNIRLIEYENYHVYSQGDTVLSRQEIVYRPDGQVGSRIETSTNWPRPSPQHFYHYDSNGTLSNIEQEFWETPSQTVGRVQYSYDQGNITEIQTYYGHSDFNQVREFQFISPTHYTFTQNNCSYGCNFSSFEVATFLNSEGNIITYHRTNTDTAETYVLHFEYENGNLTKIISDTDVHEITYDTQKSFHTYYNGYTPTEAVGPVAGIAGFIYSLFFGSPFYELNRIPGFFGYTPINNPLEHRLNGEVIRSFSYKYNEYGYPSEISTNISYPITKILTYEEYD